MKEDLRFLITNIDHTIVEDNDLDSPLRSGQIISTISWPFYSKLTEMPNLCNNWRLIYEEYCHTTSTLKKTFLSILLHQCKIKELVNMYMNAINESQGNIKYCAMLGLARMGIDKCNKDIILISNESKNYYDIMYSGISLVLLKDIKGLTILEKLVRNELEGDIYRGGQRNRGALKNIRAQLGKENVGRRNDINARMEYVLIFKFLKEVLGYSKPVMYIVDEEIENLFSWCNNNVDRINIIDQDRYFKRNPIYLYLPMLIGKK